MARSRVLLTVLALGAISCAPAVSSRAPTTATAVVGSSVRRSTAARVTTIATPAIEDGGTLNLPCMRDGDDAQAALQSIATIDREIKAIAANAPADAIAAEIMKLLDAPCFRLAIAPNKFEFDSALSLKKFWDDGGRWWLENQMALDGDGDHSLVIPPSAQRTLASDIQKDSPLAPILCPADAALADSNSPCGRETLGWIHRAEESFARDAQAKRAAFLDWDSPGEPPPSRPRCESTATAEAGADEPDVYTKYVSCMDRTELREALPLGRFAAPKDGWLVVRGRRGHYSPCNGIEAIDLASGSYYSVKSCAAGMMGGAPATGVVATIGRVPLDAIREAALMILLTDTAQAGVRTNGAGWTIPPAIKIQSTGTLGFGFGMSSGWSSGRTTLDAAWIKNGKGQARTTVHWPDAYDAMHSHATELLTIAETELVEGCAPAKAPRLPWDAMGPRIDPSTYEPTFEDSVYDDLRAAFDSLPSRATCARGR